MLYIFLGADDYTKKQEIKALVKDKGADLVVLEKQEDMPEASKLLETDLFSKPKVFVFESFMPDIHRVLEKLIQSQNYIIISITALDKRKTENKSLLSNQLIIAQQFILPHGQALNKWIVNRVGELGGKIANPAVEELAKRLGRDNFKETKFGGKVVEILEVYSLWQADNEIKKLLSFAGGRQVEKIDVESLVNENWEIDAFEITNAIGEGRKLDVFNLMQKFILAEGVGEEKGAVIHLNALLSDQLRSLAMVQSFGQSKISDEEVLEKTGWKSGRLFIMKKLANKVQNKKIMETLPKLEALDEELKTTSTPPRVLLDMIVAQIF